MDALTTRSLQATLALALAGLLGASLTGCGAPRVQEVYRLGAAEPWSDSVQHERLTRAQSDLRQLAITAHRHSPRLRSANATNEHPGAASPLILGSSSLHGCLPGDIAEFTIGSASRPAGNHATAAPMVLAGALNSRHW
jgi:hypothetical protein